MTKKRVIVVATLILCLISSKVLAAPKTTRIYGDDRYETAAKVCNTGWKGKSNYAVVVSGENFPDAVSAAPLAKKYNAPILLTNKNVLNMYTSVELKRLGVKNVFLVGQKGVISQNVEDGLKAMGIKTTRIGGKDRYETSLEVAKKLGKPKQIAIVNGSYFEDAVSMAPIAAIKGMPILMVGKDSVDSKVMSYINSNKKAEQIYVIGGEDIISRKVFNSIPNAKRVGKGDKYQRNIDIINYFRNEMNMDNLFLASGRSYADALAGSTLAALDNGFILLGDSPLPSSTTKFLSTEVVNNLTILGGPSIIGYDLESAAKYLPKEVSYVSDVYDNIYQNDDYTPPKSLIARASDGSKVEVDVNWNLKKVNTSKPGLFTFYGDVEGYYRRVALNLVVNPIPIKIPDVYKTSYSRYDFVLPEKVLATLSDGTSTELPVVWDYGTQQKNSPGLYVFNGTVDRYNKKVKLTLQITDTGGGYPSNIFDDTTMEIVQGEPYKLPKTVLDKVTNKNMPVTWNTRSIDTSKTGIVRLEGTVKDSPYKAYMTLIVLPKIKDIPEIRVRKVQGEYYYLPNQILATTSDDRNIWVDVTWDNPFIDMGTPQTYYIKGRVKHYDKPVLLVLEVVSN
ncbi:cell wall-binding repeat-containing protein [Clostridium sp. MSJ-11]|uniref:Cell wall-binding repeat-containing protein n=1 Tax=Clostridium mobile TaxID=2841512 RepID=A0ABS6EKH1_9CLOT|nr:cell wall-binding repeat-containing protein [Clostridium mobile]MBU5485715.1 cell wall-binding repeat-containing protein [Clostridium mobile]